MTKPQPSRSSREKALLFMVLVAALGFLGWKFVYIPLRAQAAQMRCEREQLQGEIDLLEDKISRKAALEMEWKHMEREGERLSTVLPDRDQLPIVFANLGELIARHPVNLRLLRTEGFSDQDGCPGLSFQAGFEGPDDNLFMLFEEIERFPHLLVVADTSWRGEADSSQLVMTFALVFRENN